MLVTRSFPDYLVCKHMVGIEVRYDDQRVTDGTRVHMNGEFFVTADHLTQCDRVPAGEAVPAHMVLLEVKALKNPAVHDSHCG